MPLRREKERQKLERDLCTFFAKGGEITKLKPTDRAEHITLSKNERLLVNGPWFGKGV